MEYNFLDNNFFNVYENVETPETSLPEVILRSPLFGDSRIDWADNIIVNPEGKESIIAKDNISDKLNIFNTEKPDEIYNQNTISKPEEISVNTTNTSKNTSNNNANYSINFLMNRLGLTKEQAAGITGVIISESGLNPRSYNKAEKAGKLKSSKANGRGYGAGIIQWSNERKKLALKLIGKENSNIEDLSIDDQLEMLARELEGPYKNTLAGIRSSKTASEAAATMYCHNVGGFSSSNKVATQSEINAMNNRYSKFTGSNPNNFVVNRGMKYAESLLNQ